jgi:hypothetical protein
MVRFFGQHGEVFWPTLRVFFANMVSLICHKPWCKYPQKYVGWCYMYWKHTHVEAVCRYIPTYRYVYI